MNWLHYLLEANLYLCVFYAGYCLFLNKETHYTLNRVYLLLSCIVSFIIPVVQVGWLKNAERATQTMVVIRHGAYQQTVITAAARPALTAQDILIYAYAIGVGVLAIMLFVKLYQLTKLTKTTKTLVDNRYKLVNIEGSNTAFSFFNYLFIGTKTATDNIIIKHELVHIRQKHSADIVFLELIKIINWFNPFVYLLQISLKSVHEYIADEQTAAQESDALSYSSFLVSNAYGLNGSSLTHSFFNYNLLKKRIIMLNQKRSGNLARLKYLVAVPICAGLLCASTLVFSKTYGFIDLLPKLQVANQPQTIAHNAAPDTAVDPVRINKAAITAKGYKYEETGYLIDGKTDFRVIITDKSGDHKEYYKSKAKPDELATLKDKYGYSFPKMLIFPKLPPPPPVPAAPAPHKLNKQMLPPPPPPAKKNKKVKIVDVVLLPPPPVEGATPPAPAEPASASTEPTPPPPPADPFENLYKFIGKYTRYPTKALESRVSGRVILTFNINNGKITDVNVARGIDPKIDNEIVRVLNKFDSDLSVKSGSYNIPVLMALADSKGNWSDPAPQKQYAHPKTMASGKPSVTLHEVVIVGYPI